MIEFGDVIKVYPGSSRLSIDAIRELNGRLDLAQVVPEDVVIRYFLQEPGSI